MYENAVILDGAGVYDAKEGLLDTLLVMTYYFNTLFKGILMPA